MASKLFVTSLLLHHSNGLNQTMILRMQALKTRLELLESLNAASVVNNQPSIQSASTAYLMFCTAFVLMMTLPGLALFYGGMSQVKNILSTVFMTFSVACCITIAYFIFGYSLALSKGAKFIGGSGRFWLIGTNSSNQFREDSIHPWAPEIPESVYFFYQCTLAILTAGIICGSFAGSLSVYVSTFPSSKLAQLNTSPHRQRGCA